MPQNSAYEVVVIGAGPAGITAALCLAKADFSVLVLEAGAFAGAENWSGAVYFSETLTRSDVLGLEEIEKGAIERRVVKRGFYVYNGHSMVGLSYRNPKTFENCYTVLRPVFDHWLAEKAKRFGVTVLSETTAESLIRHDGRIIGVNTDRGPVYADCVFLAEGDASHLVTKEGYERLSPQSSALRPKFLQGIKEVVELDPAVIEKNFGVGPGEAACYEVLLRNGILGNRPARLNAGGFLYTNLQSVSLGIVLPLDNLARNFNGDHNRLMEWFKGLPEIQRWVGGSQSVAYGAKIIRGGGVKELPQLVDNGLAIGGAATGIGLDFPYPNFTGPACAMGFLFAESLKKLREDKQPPTKANLERLYEQPLRKTHYFKNVEFLRNWPGYVEQTKFFFDRYVDLVNGSLFALSNPELRGFARWWQVAKLARETVPLKKWGEVFADLRRLNCAIPTVRLALRNLTPRALGCWLLNTIWPFRRQFVPPPPSSVLDLSFSVDAKTVPWENFPWPIRHLVHNYGGALAEAAHSLYHNDDTPLEKKLQSSLGFVIRNANLWDVLLWGGAKLMIWLLMPIQWACEMGRYAIKRPTVEEFLKTFYRRWLATTRQIGKLDDGDVKIAQPWEDKLGTISYLSEKTPHIKVLRPALFEKRTEIQTYALWHICPAKVYECHTDDLGQSQVVVNWENCVKCESCWRGNDNVDWSRHRAHRLIYRSYTPAEAKVLELMSSGGDGDAAKRRRNDKAKHPASSIQQPAADLLRKLARTIHEFSVTLHREPRDLDRNRVLWLQSIIEREEAILSQISRFRSEIPNWPDLKQRHDDRVRNAARGRFFWAESDGQQILTHHLRRLGIEAVEARRSAPLVDSLRTPIRKQIEEAFTKQAVKALDHGDDFTAAQKSLLKKLAIKAAESADARKVVLEELGRVEPSAALLLSHHLIGCELAGQPVEGAWKAVAGSGGKATLVPLALAEEFVVAGRQGATVIPRGEATIHRLQTSGLRAARLAHLEWQADLSDSPDRFDPSNHSAAAANDLLSIALGASTMLIERATAHAATRVQFPGLFKDEHGRDGVGKFGAVKRMLAEMEANRYMLETLSYFPHKLTPEEVKLVTAEAFGTMPGSVTYNAGQIVGGPAFSEDDIYSKFYRDSGAWSWLWWENSPANLDNFAASNLASVLPKIRPLIEQRNRKRQDEGIPSEKELEIEKLLRQRTTTDQPVLRPQSSLLGAGILSDGYFDKPLESPIRFSYAALMKTCLTYNYGDFLVNASDFNAPRYLPEHLHFDAELRAFNEEMRDYFRKNFAERTAEGLPYARFIEKHHKVPEKDVFALIDRGLLRMPIPQECGGEGLSKAHYYVLITNAMRYGEPGVSLTIQANTSIGTTPILLGLKQDLPRARKDLESFLRDDSAVVAIGKETGKILGMLNTPAVLKVKDKFIALGEKVKADIGKRPMLRAIASDFLDHFLQAARAGQRQDLKMFESNLKQALDCMPQFKGRAETMLSELGRREEAHRLFLRLISSGQIAAFALTEPGAGSDSAGVQTRATLKKAEVFTDADGVKFFHLDEEKKLRRNLVDAARVKFDGRKILYEITAGKPPVELHWPEPGEGPAKPRWFHHHGKKIEFFDIGQVREADGRQWFEFFELNGAKMWITNAHISGVHTLYAKTKEGVTGFMVDRFAEGMIVGKDEEKMGQRGSPTNELGLNAVRVPRECVIGIEGRGQVNALETLNVGRAGLCVSTVAMMLKIVEQTRAFVKEHRLEDAPHVHELLGAMTEELYATESVAYELIGLFDHPGTESVRMESAIGKYYGSEALHRVIRWAEAIHGCHSQTAQYEIEKHRRDARVLNIYEGTNEVQRFLILKDLAQDTFGKWKDDKFVGEIHPKLREQAETLKRAKQLLRQRLEEALDMFGQQIWQNPGFQAAFFKLADKAGFIKVIESVLIRTQWLLNNISDDAPAEDRRHRDFALQAAANYCARASRQVDALDAALREEFAQLKQGIYPPNIRVATLVFEEHEERAAAAAAAHPSETASPLEATLCIAVLVKPVPLLSPRPHVCDGKLLESHFEINPFDRAALVEALRIKRSSPGPVAITTVSAAPAYARELLRQTLAMGCDEAVWIDTGTRHLPDEEVAKLLAGAVRDIKPGLVLAGCRATDANQGVVGALVADDLNIVFVPRATRLGIAGEQNGKVIFRVELEQFPDVALDKKAPLLVTWATEAARPVRGAVDQFTIEGFLRSFDKPLRVIRPSEAKGNGLLRLRLPQKPTRAAEEGGERTPEGAAKLFARAAGLELGGGSGDKVKKFEGQIAEKSPSALSWKNCVVYLSEPPSGAFSPGALQSLDVAVELARHLQMPLRTVVCTRADEALLRKLAGDLAPHDPGEIVFVTSEKFEGGVTDVFLQALQKLWNTENRPAYVVGPAWANELLARFANAASNGDGRIHLHENVKEIVAQGGSLEFIAPAYEGKVEAVEEETARAAEEEIITLTAGADFVGRAERPKIGASTESVTRVTLDLSYDVQADDLAKLFLEATTAAGAESLKEAEFIIDVGYAIANKENYEVVITPLKKTLEELGVKGVRIGGSRKVVEELKLLRADQQIGQTGVSVNPTVLLAIGISGAPQHLDYIGEAATIISFNKDPQAPIMTLNQRRARPKVYPVVGDLFQTVPKFMEGLKALKD